MGIELLTTTDAFEQVIKENKACLLFKHSLTCPISADAREVYEKYREETELPMYMLYVQDHRDVSNYVAEYFDIKHESPQFFYIKDGKVEFHTSHWHITTEKLQEVVK